MDKQTDYQGQSILMIVVKYSERGWTVLSIVVLKKSNRDLVLEINIVLCVFA